MADAGESQTLEMVRVFLDQAHFATPGQLPDVVHSAAQVFGWTPHLFLADYEQRLLVPVPTAAAQRAGRPSEPLAEPQGIDSTLAGWCFRTVQPIGSPSGEPWVWLPVVDGAERLGVIGVALPHETITDDPQFEERCRLLGHLTGHLIAAKRPYGDALDRVRRLESRSVASELLQEVLPPLTFACEGLVVSGFLQPTYAAAADAFDYSVVDDTAHLAIFDATGHDLEAASLAAVALAAYRNRRREGQGLHGAARGVDEFVAAYGADWRYASGVLAELQLTTGRLRYLNAGHPQPLLIRRGKVVKELGGGHRVLFGIEPSEDEPLGEETLEPGDWLMFYTDGIVEARDEAGIFFGLERLVEHLEMAAATRQPAPETLRRISHAVLEHQQGLLQDDATLLLAEWATGKESALTSWSWPGPATVKDVSPGGSGVDVRRR